MEVKLGRFCYAPHLLGFPGQERCDSGWEGSWRGDFCQRYLSQGRFQGGALPGENQLKPDSGSDRQGSPSPSYSAQGQRRQEKDSRFWHSLSSG